MDNITHLLVVGAPRSGTTLFACMIAGHTDVALLKEVPEMYVQRLLSKKVVGNKLCVPNQIELKKQRRIPGRDFWKKIGLAKRTSTSTYCIEEYLDLPNPKIIAITRDGNDVISSNMRRGNKSLKTSSYRWCRAIEVIHELKRCYDDKVLVTSFEELVEDPEGVMRKVADFLGLDYQERMLEGYKFSSRWYPESNISKDKAYRHKSEDIDLDLPNRFPEIYQKYQELLALSKSEAGKQKPEVGIQKPVVEDQKRLADF